MYGAGVIDASPILYPRYLIMYDHMLIDAKNCMYRAVYAGLSDSNQNSLKLFFRFISSYIHQFKPKSIHFFWDAPRETLWRKSIYPEYKEGRVRNNPEHSKAELQVCESTKICLEMLENLNTRNYKLKYQEADDLVYAFCRLRCHDKIIIISSDGDFKQIPYVFRNVSLYNPLGKHDKLYLGQGEVDPVDIKCFMGEKTDNIMGYNGIGHVKSIQLLNDHHKRNILFKEQGPELYLLNRKLVDLSMCPYLHINIYYIFTELSRSVRFDFDQIRKIIYKYKIKGMTSNQNEILLPFRDLQ